MDMRFWKEKKELVSGSEGVGNLPASRITSEYALVVLGGRIINVGWLG